MSDNDDDDNTGIITRSKRKRLKEKEQEKKKRKLKNDEQNIKIIINKKSTKEDEIDLLDTESDSDYDPENEEDYDDIDGFIVPDDEDDYNGFLRILGKKIFNNINKRLEEEEQKNVNNNLFLDEIEKKYFENLSEQEQEIIKNKNKEVLNYNKVDIPLKIKILKSHIPISTKSFILKKFNNFNEMMGSESEYNKMKKYIEGLERIPFGKNIEMPIKKTDSYKTINNFIKKSYTYLEDSIYGQKETKIKILQILAKWISNPESKGSVIALQGPPGVGKTTILKQGLAKALGRPFSFIALGGATDSSFLEGHSYTYEGSMCGRIVSILMETQCMNPIIFFDELDKVSETKHGEEIIGILTHLTDPSQNTNFHDKYYSGIDFDLSKSLIFFSYNDPSKINPILKDRILTINVKGFKIDDKVKIARQYLIKEICLNVGLDHNNIIISDEIIKHIINNFTNEEGVRELKRKLETIILKINLMRFTDIDLDYRIKDFKFPITLSLQNVENLLGKNNKPNDNWTRMYI